MYALDVGKSPGPRVSRIQPLVQAWKKMA